MWYSGRNWCVNDFCKNSSSGFVVYGTHLYAWRCTGYAKIYSYCFCITRRCIIISWKELTCFWITWWNILYGVCLWICFRCLLFYNAFLQTAYAIVNNKRPLYIFCYGRSICIAHQFVACMRVLYWTVPEFEKHRLSSQINKTNGNTDLFICLCLERTIVKLW